MLNRGRKRQPNEPDNANTPLPWIEAADNPWGVRVLDVRPVTLNMISTSSDPRMAENAISYRQDAGISFIGQAPQNPRVIDATLKFKCGSFLADGVMFTPIEMEHKWAIFYHRQQIIFVRSWLRQVYAIASVTVSDGEAIISSIRGTLTDPDEAPEFTIRVADYLIRSHVLDMVIPAPLPSDIEPTLQGAGLWCMNVFGNKAIVATAESLPITIPDRPLRTYSLLHIAIASGDLDWANELLDEGIPVDLLAQDLLTPLHWAMARPDTQAAEFLLAHGSPVDVRSSEGATPLMNAVQSGKESWLSFFLERGADINAADYRGFTALHRAAEMGHLAMVEILLHHGAAKNPVAQGHTPLSLAQQKGHTAIVELLQKV